MMTGAKDKTRVCPFCKETKHGARPIRLDQITPIKLVKTAGNSCVITLPVCLKGKEVEIIPRARGRFEEAEWKYENIIKLFPKQYVHSKLTIFKEIRKILKR